MDLSIIIDDVLQVISERKKFTADQDVKAALLEALTGIEFRHEVEAYEFIMLVYDKTYENVRIFEDPNKDFWFPILQYNIETNKGILINADSPEHAALSSFYPLTPVLAACKQKLVQIQNLVNINKMLKGKTSTLLSTKGEYIINEIKAHFRIKDCGNRYMSATDVITTFDTILMNAYNYLIAIENVSSSTSDFNNVTPITTVKKQEAQPVVQQAEVVAEVTAVPVQTVMQHIEQNSVAQPTENSNDDTEVVEEHKCTVAPLSQRVNVVLIEDIIQTKDFELKTFGEVYQTLLSQYTFSQKYGLGEDVDKIYAWLTDLFEVFDVKYKKVQEEAKSKRKHSLSYDETGWKNTANDIERQKQKLINH